MTSRGYIYTLITLYICSIFLAISADDACDKSRCKGPVKYYEDVGCIPTYSDNDTCCAVKYDCGHLQGRSKDKCYYKSHVYEIGQNLKPEDASPCDKQCRCSRGHSDAPAHFRCAIVDCFARPTPGCYLKSSHERCCPGPRVCLGFPVQNDTGIPRCEVDGKTYLDGQRFPQSDPNLSCICSEGYTGQNVAPFCKPVKPHTCKVELRHAADLYKNCTPAFYSSQNPATDCNLFSRCPNKNDTVIVSETATETGVAPVSESDSICTFGQLEMKIGDQLNQATDYSSMCLKCVCEVPPTPTCQRLPDADCDITVHSKYDNSSK